LQRGGGYFSFKKDGVDKLLEKILNYLPEAEPFYSGDDLSDLPTKFFVGELIREKISNFTRKSYLIMPLCWCRNSKRKQR
jgi:GTP-binding protein Era